MNQQKIKSITRNGFTLVELLLVLAIIAILTGFLATAITGARKAAMERRNEVQYERIRSILQLEIDDILDSPLSVGTPVIANIGRHFEIDPEGRFSRLDRFRMEAKRSLLISRFPYHSTIVHAANYGHVNVLDARRNLSSRFFDVPTSFRNKLLFDLYSDGANGYPVLKLPAAAKNEHAEETLEENIAKHDANSSEMLYRVLENIWVDDEPALSLFRESEFGDTDADGRLEILDAYGEPIFSGFICDCHRLGKARSK